ncbi:unnamed protein product [Ixodes pacificus]
MYHRSPDLGTSPRETTRRQIGVASTRSCCCTILARGTYACPSVPFDCVSGVTSLTVTVVAQPLSTSGRSWLGFGPRRLLVPVWVCALSSAPFHTPFDYDSASGSN